MEKTVNSILTEAMRLPPSERNKLIDALLTSLEAEEIEGIDESWAEEVEKRFSELQRGSVKSIPWSTVKQRASSKGPSSSHNKKAVST